VDSGPFQPPIHYISDNSAKGTEPVALLCKILQFSGRRKRYGTMPEYAKEQTKTTNGNPQPVQQPKQHPSQPLEVQPDGTWILGRGADRWMPTPNQIGNMRWLVEKDLRNELGVPPQYARDEEKIEFHKRQLALLDLAKQAPRCEHVFSDGRCCKAPRVKKGKLCYAHTLMEEKRPLLLNLPPLEDANAVMLWLMDVSRGLLEGRISERTAGLMFYGLQLAMVNARFTTFKDTKHAEMVTIAPKRDGNRKPQRTRRNAKDENEDQLARSEFPRLEAGALPQRAPRNTEEGDRPDRAAFHPKPAEAASLGTPALPTSPTAEPGLAGSIALKAPVPPESPISEPENRGGETCTGDREEGEIEPKKNGSERVSQPGHPEGIPGVESAKSIFFGVEAGEGVADNRPVSPPSQPPRKGSRSEVPDDLEECAGR
jgi:hypothetical protein